jgi:soluble lytic murein transglycosylase-like protein/TolA-binding protein
MYNLAKDFIDTLSTFTWLEKSMDFSSSMPESILKEVLMQLISSNQWTKLDSTLLQFLKNEPFDKKQCFLCSLVSSDTINNNVLSTETLFLLSKFAYSCMDYSLSSRLLHKALKRKNFLKVVPHNTYVYHRAILNYRLKNYLKSIKWALNFDKKYGSDPGLVYIIARSYRNLGKGTKASYWYDKHIRLFPRHKKTQDIIWYRAWQKEDANKFDDARKFYRMIFKKYRSSSLADDSHFRYALTYCKEKDFKSALKSFSSFLALYPYSNLVMDVRYWMAKCYYAMKNNKSAVKKCKEIIEMDPTNYYAFRAREMIYLINDSTLILTIDTISTLNETIHWLDSLSQDSPDKLDSKDSTMLKLGGSLAAIGMIKQAEYVLKPLEKMDPKNLIVQFQLARLYKLSNAPTISFRVAVKLSWRIPETARENMSKYIYTLLYPNSFFELIAKNSTKYNIEPALVSSIIRQESIFNPVIESPVGAIGLMQIMPYTGEEIANDLKDTFYLDSLYSPGVNIRYGTYYIRKLLNQFNNDLILAVASYNGGPHNAKRWRSQNSDDGFDMFIEDIGFSETRKYIKKVLGNYWTYIHLEKINIFPNSPSFL